MKITTKYKKETDKELKHEDIYVNERYVGYIIKDNDLLQSIEPWHFISKVSRMNNCKSKTRKQLLINLETNKQEDI